MTTKKHKHAELIHKWAEGATIQVGDGADCWIDCPHPSWREKLNYRVKPKAMRRVVVARVECPAMMQTMHSDHGSMTFAFSNRQPYPVTVEVSREIEE